MAPKNKKPPKNKKAPKIKEDVYKARLVIFKGKSISIVSRSKGGDSSPCPLVGLSNLLLLRRGASNLLYPVSMPDGTKSVSQKKLQAFVSFMLCGELEKRKKAGTLNQDLKEYDAALEELRRDKGLFPEFTSTSTFSCINEMLGSLYRTLHVCVHHALLPDPKDTDVYAATKNESCLELMLEFQEYQAESGSGKHYEDSYHDKMCLVKQFVIDGPEFTPYGLDRLREEAPDKELFLFHLNGDLHVAYKEDRELYLLATEEDMFDKYPDIMWIGLDEKFNVENPGETERKLTSSFSPVNVMWNVSATQLLEEGQKKEKTREGKRKEALMKLRQM